jgi:hypothetical protein
MVDRFMYVVLKITTRTLKTKVVDICTQKRLTSYCKALLILSCLIIPFSPRCRVRQRNSKYLSISIRGNLHVHMVLPNKFIRLAIHSLFLSMDA